MQDELACEVQNRKEKWLVTSIFRMYYFSLVCHNPNGQDYILQYQVSFIQRLVHTICSVNVYVLANATKRIYC